jgi:hypothetical protein
LTNAKVHSSWRIHGELAGGHRPSETIAFVSELQDIADERSPGQRTLPAGVVSPDIERQWLSRARRWFGR